MCAYLCYHGAWNSYVESGVGLYAVGSPSVEMYMDSYNQWGGYSSGRGPLSYKWQSTNVSGYNVGTNGYYPYSEGGNSGHSSLSSGPNSMYYTYSLWWIASPSCDNATNLLYTDNRYSCISSSVSGSVGLAPVVCLGN